MESEPRKKMATEDVYGGQLRLSVRVDGGERRSLLTVCAQLNKCEESLFKKVFSVYLTDENDPFFYYQLKLNDEDYQNLRVQQGLLVDFNAFPQKFAHLLEQCRMEEENDNPKFVLVFHLSARDGTGQLNVVETNPFKHLVHLSLRLVVGSDVDVRCNLTRRLSTLKEQNNKLMTELRNTESDLKERLYETKLSVSARQAEVERLRVELKEQENSLNDKWQRELMREQERANMVQREMKKQHEELVRRLGENVNVSESRAGELGERLRGHESTVRELRNRVGVLEDELRLSRHESLEAKNQKIRFERECSELEGEVNRLTSRLSLLERQIVDDEVQSRQLRTVAEAAQDQKNKSVEEAERLRSVLEKRESSLKMLAEEVNKGNEIIRKLQTEIKSLHTKLKLRNKVVQEQEKSIAEKDRTVESLRLSVASHDVDAKQQNEQITKLRDSLNEAETKMESDAKLIKTNENVINWLNKQLNEYQVDRQRGVVAAGTTIAPGSVGPFGTPFVTSTPGENVCPTSSFPPSRPVVQYQPTQASVQLVCSKRPVFETIPEDPNSPRNDKNPPLDPKYLQSKGRGQSETSKFPSNRSSSQPINTRFTSQMRFAPPIGTNAIQDSRYRPSAYFPS